MSPETWVEEALREVRLFAGLDGELRGRVASAARVLRLSAGEWCYRQGAPADGIAVVVTGRLAVETETDGRTKVVRHLGAGASLGELGVLTGSARTASVRAVRDSVLVVISQRDFDALLEDDGRFAVALARSLATDLSGVSPQAMPDAPAGVFAVVGLDAGANPGMLASSLTVALGQWGSCVSFDGTAGGAGGSDDSWGALLSRAESDSEFVVLVADDPSAEPDWLSFCLRSADRVVAVVGGGRRLEWVNGTAVGCDLVVTDSMPLALLVGWTDELRPRSRHVVRTGSTADVARMARRLTGRSLGLVLSGGGARGLAHIGVLAELSAAGVEVDHVGGCSMGSFVAAMFALGWEPPRMEEVCRRELARRLFPNVKVPGAALLKARRSIDMLRRIFGDGCFEQTEIEAFSVAADLVGGGLVVDRSGPLAEAVASSMAVPGLLVPVVRGDRVLVDGGVLDNLPVDVMADLHEGRVLAVDVMRRPSSPGGQAPGFVNTIARAMVVGGRNLAEANRTRADIVVSPQLDELGFLDFDRIDDAIAAGRRAGREALAALADGESPR